MKRNYFFTFCLTFIATGLIAQNNKCATMEVHAKNVNSYPEFNKNRAEIELFTQKYVEENSAKRSSNTLHEIPVVVHIVHFGEAIGTGSNISDAQVTSQMSILNQDFRLKNSDSLQPSHPFWPFTADSGIEFVLADKDETGNPTSGIIRYEGVEPYWFYSEVDDIIKPNTIWNRDKYLNIWVIEFEPNETTLGFAQFPGGPADTDGVVIRHQAFGTNGTTTAPYNKGRTLTHEVGHWLNLSHIWGDDVCGDDLVADTEEAEEDNSGCPSFPHNAFNSCGTGADGEMYMNYMDYCDDVCLVMFTYDQTLRMRAALEGPRSSLLPSGGNNNTSIESATLNMAVGVFPNPASDLLTVELKDGDLMSNEISIINYSGQTMFTSVIDENTSKHTIDIRSIPSGVYFIQITNSSSRLVKKLTVIRK